MPINLSIIIVSYNTKKLLTDCLTSIGESFKDSIVKYEIIVIDNNSTDGSYEVIKKGFPKIKVIQNQTNVGYGRANNQGIKAAKGEVILLLNSDTLVRERGIERLYRFLMTQDKKTIVGGKLFNVDTTPQDSCGPAYTLPVIFEALFLKGDYRHTTRYSPDNMCEVDWVMGACLMAYKETFSEVGFFDEAIFMYMDEIDFLYRAKQKGYRILFFPDAHFIHLGSGSSKGRETPIINVFKGFIYFYKKHYSIFQQIILRILLVLKSVLGIIFFSILNKKYDRNLYIRALLITIHI